MRCSFFPRLVNGPFSDPVLFIPFHYEKRALLFDLGDLRELSPRDLLKISHVFVTHTHMDHFIGFDSLVRIFLGRDKNLHLFGPPGFTQQVEGKLSGYTWNLVHEYETEFRILASEINGKSLITRTYECNKAFKAEGPPSIKPFRGLLLEEPSFSVKAVLLDHRTACLGLALEEHFHVNIIKEKLKELDLQVGPWINQFKKAVYERRDPESPFQIPENKKAGARRERTFILGDLTANIARISSGQKIAYVTDVAGSPENRDKIVQLAENADHFFVEAAFLERDQAIARRKYHLTAREAGNLGRKAGVKQLHPFHFSPRYEGSGEELEKEAMEALTHGK